MRWIGDILIPHPMSGDPVNVVIHADVHAFVVPRVDSIRIVGRIQVLLADQEFVAGAGRDVLDFDLTPDVNDAGKRVSGRPRKERASGR